MPASTTRRKPPRFRCSSGMSMRQPLKSMRPRIAPWITAACSEISFCMKWSCSPISIGDVLEKWDAGFVHWFADDAHDFSIVAGYAYRFTMVDVDHRGYVRSIANALLAKTRASRASP